MNVLRLSTLSLVWAIVGITFSLSTRIASAHGEHPHAEDCTGPHKKDDNCDSGSGGGGGDGDVYTVTIGGDVGGGSDDGFPWSRSGGKNSIGGPPRPNAGALTNVTNFFMALPGGVPFNADQANECFGVGTFDLYAGGLGTGKKGVAQAQFWFEAETFVKDLDRKVFYQLRYLGGFSGADWLPAAGKTSFLNMDEWRLTATNEGEDIKAISCIGEGPANVQIDVTNVTGQ